MDDAGIDDVFGAIEAGDAEQVRALVGADPARAAARNADGLSAVLAAQYRHRPDLVAVLLEAKPDLDVFDAAAVGDVDRLRALLDADRALVHAYAPDGFFPLALAAYFAQPDAVAFLLDRGADPGTAARNPSKVQALHAAVAGRSAESVKLLLDAGADPNAQQESGFTPLMAAEQHDDREIIDLLLQAGAAPSENRSTTS
jgi:adenosylhomocysteine nucleosidase